MTKLTKEQLFEKLQHRIAVAAKYPDLEEAQLDAEIFKIALASLEAEPVGEFYHEKQGGWYQISEGDKVSDNRRIPLYAAPVLPKQPELIGMKVSIDTGSDNIGHRLFGEVVGINDSNGVPVLCIEVSENNGDMAAPAQPVIPRELHSFVTDTDIAALHRFAECCDDPESGGHDLEKEQVQRLEKIGALQRSGRISYITDFGDYLISVAPAQETNND